MEPVKWNDASSDLGNNIENAGIELKNVPVVGVIFENRQMLLMEVDEDDEVILKKEPDNPYDANAIKVLAKGLHVGYLPRTMASSLVKYSEDQMKARITAIYKDTEISGMRIDIIILNQNEPANSS
jgi:hypothetical protein